MIVPHHATDEVFQGLIAVKELNAIGRKVTLNGALDLARSGRPKLLPWA